MWQEDYWSTATRQVHSRWLDMGWQIPRQAALPPLWAPKCTHCQSRWGKGEEQGGSESLPNSPMQAWWAYRRSEEANQEDLPHWDGIWWSSMHHVCCTSLQQLTGWYRLPFVPMLYYCSQQNVFIRRGRQLYLCHIPVQMHRAFPSQWVSQGCQPSIRFACQRSSQVK